MFKERKRERKRAQKYVHSVSKFNIFIMTLVSNKLIQQITTAISQSQSQYRVLSGQQRLVLLRQRYDYQRGLAAYLAQTNSPNDRLLALLQLRKMATMTEEQTAYQLRDIYFNDIDKAASMVRNLMSHPSNLKWTALFLDFPFLRMGCLQSIRYIELLFELLAKPVEGLVQLNFEIIQAGILELVEIVAESEQMMRMLTVIVALFYQQAKRVHQSHYHESLEAHWRQFIERSKFNSTPTLSLLKTAISNQLAKDKTGLPPKIFSEMLMTIFRHLDLNNEQESKFDGQQLRLIHKNCLIFNCMDDTFDLILLLNKKAIKKYQEALTATSNSLTLPLTAIFQKDQQSQAQKMISTVINSLIEEIFDEHYSSIAQTYKQQQRPLFLYFLPMLNYFNGISNPRVQLYTRDHVPQVFNHVGLFLTHLKMENDRNEELLTDFLSCLEFLVNYKSLIQIQMLPHICGLLQEISVMCSTLSPLSYLFLEEVWEELAMLDHYQLSTFMVAHLQAINNNEWDHQLSYYSCFLHLSCHLEETYQVLSNLVPDKDLYQESIRAQRIIVGMLEQGCPIKQGEEHLLALLVGLTASLMGDHGRQSMELYRALNIDYISKLVDRLGLQGEGGSEKIRCFDRWRRQVGRQGV